MGEIFSLLIRLAHFLRSFTIKSPCFVMQLRPLFPLFIALCKPRLELSLCKKMILSRLVMIFAKGGFFQKVRFVFQIFKIDYSKSLSWTWNLKFPPLTVNNLFKFQAQDSDLEYFFWDLINESHFLKKKKTKKNLRFFLWNTSNMAH